MPDLASNRQKKLLRFCGVRFGPNLTSGAAGWEIGAILSDDYLRERWEKYLYLTRDFDGGSDELKPYSEDELEALELPDGWNSSDELQKFRDEIVESVLDNAGPFDNPQPNIEFAGRTFAFTGKFDFGTRKECQEAITKRGGTAPAKVSINADLDYLVIGTQGSPSYKRGSYGTKIEKAILARRKFGAPSIVSEDHWVAELKRND